MLKKRLKIKVADNDIDLMPIMNLFSILLPFLLSMAVFQKMAIVEVFMDSQTDGGVVNENVSQGKLNLTVALKEQGFEIWARNGSLPQIFTKEIVEIRCKTDENSHRHDRRKEAQIRCLDGSLATPFDVEKFHLFKLQRNSESDPGVMVKTVKNANDSVLIHPDGSFVSSKTELRLGQVYGTLNAETRTKWEVKNHNDAREDYLSAYDELAQILIGLNEKFVDLEDADQIVILADDKMEFDKIIQAMDVAKGAGFENVQLAKLSES